ncbi:hypothetical protein BRADI_3g45245v3 [Brachypodium distachyon]|uniref:Uncharacterized protein n=1 Tax=Brachypodium distachyon TaxID=15368 RepID=A0A2K2D3E3_BRADI|nr:hypothetical protein BRADI_3g45245v3 [Brachypodium distachyon]
MISTHPFLSSYVPYISLLDQGLSWSSAPMELCCREGPEGGTVPRGKKPKKLLEMPLASGLPLNGRVPLDAWQLDTSNRSTRRNHHGCTHGLLLLRAWK